MAKMLIITDCEKCPYSVEGHDGDMNWCNLANEPLPELGTGTIPDWCPLEDTRPTEEVAALIGKPHEAWVKGCTCLPICPIGCHGTCGCEACSESYDDALAGGSLDW